MTPIPDRLVVLSFDDGNASDLSYVAPVLDELGFGATFFVTEGLGVLDPAESWRYLSWGEVRELHERGFEIGNHTRSHPDVTSLAADELVAEIEHIQRRCEEHGIPRPTTFCYPGFRHSTAAASVLRDLGFTFARRGVGPEFPDGHRGGRGPAYDRARHEPLLVPTTGYAGPEWTFDDLAWAVDQACDGRIAMLCFHGVPGRQHPWVSVEQETFAAYMSHLQEAGCTVVSFRQLAAYVQP
jgi:peptidoglycan/xylan/chitin deacetylase (PgdA/CDA1 family)